jgi:hypothetical protein
MTKSEFNQIAKNSFRAYFAPLLAFFKAIENEWSKPNQTEKTTSQK